MIAPLSGASPDVMTNRLPPLWLSAVALTAAITVAFGVARWVNHFESHPYAEDFRVNYVAAEIGLTHGWSHIYDLDLERQLSAGSPDSAINSNHDYVAPPLVAWLMVPLTWLPLPAAYLIWTLLSLLAVVGAWWLVCPGRGIARVTLLLIALAVWPVHYAFWLGQLVAPVILCLALTWWFLERGRWAPAGAAIAVAMFVKPQLVLLLPVALLVSGRWRPVLFAAIGAGVLGAIAALSLGRPGIASYMISLGMNASDPAHRVVTYGFLFGPGLVAQGVEVAVALIALALAWYHRHRLNLVFALGMVGTTASSFYFHEYDPAVLLVAAWVVLRSETSLLQRGWLVVGVAAAQFLSIGLPAPFLFWEAGWIAFLGMEPWLARDAHGDLPVSSVPSPQA
jgi:Glycosyltransferase family 87